MQSFVNKSQIRASIFPSPAPNTCIAWGSCGILALGARSTILLYQCNPTGILFLRSVEIPDGSNPTILSFPDSTNNFNSTITKQDISNQASNTINASKSFQENSENFNRYLAIATDSSSLFLFDCISGTFVGCISRNFNSPININPSYISISKNSLSSRSTIHSIQWAKHYLLVVTSLNLGMQNNSPSSISQQSQAANSVPLSPSYLTAIDFWDDSDPSQVPSLTKSSSTINAKESNYNNYMLGKTRAKILWSLDLGEYYNKLLIDPFSMNSNHSGNNQASSFTPISNFRCLVYSSLSSSFAIIESNSPSEQPFMPIKPQTMSGVQFIVDACFHPQIKNIIVVLFSNSAIIYDFKCKIVKTILTDVGPNMYRIFMSQSNFNELVVYCRDNSFVLFKPKIKQPKKNEEEELCLNFEKVAVTQMKREVITSTQLLLIDVNPLFPEYFLAYGYNNGLFLLKNENERIIITKNQNLIPLRCTAFDSSDKITVLGTDNGKILVINNVDGTVNNIFTVSGHEYENVNSTSFVNKSSNGDSKNIQASSSNNTIPTHNSDELISVKLVTPNIIYWSTMDHFGGIDFLKPTIYMYKNRFFTFRNNVTFSANEELIVTQRDRFVVGVSHLNNLILNNENILSSSFLEVPLSFNYEVVAVCAQQVQSPATIAKFGHKPAFAVLLRNNQIHFFNGFNDDDETQENQSKTYMQFSEPLLRLRCPDDLPQPVSIAWKKNVFVTCNFNGKFIFFDFECFSSKVEHGPFGNIRRVEFDKSENGLFIHSQIDSKLGFYTNEQVDVCKTTPVYEFATTGNGLVTVMTPSHVIKVLCLTRDWQPIISMSQQSILKPLQTVEERYKTVIDNLNQLSKKSSEDKSSVQSVENRVDFALWQSKLMGLSFSTKVLMVIKKFLNSLKFALNNNLFVVNQPDFIRMHRKSVKVKSTENDLIQSEIDKGIALLEEFEDYNPKDPSYYNLPPKLAMFSSSNEEIRQKNLFRATIISNAQATDFFDVSKANNHEETPSEEKTILESALLNLQVGRLESARNSLLRFSSNGLFFPVCALAASLFGSNICETGIGILKGSSILLFDANDINSALLLLSAANLNKFSVQMLQERELYEESVNVIRLNNVGDKLGYFSDFIQFYKLNEIEQAINDEDLDNCQKSDIPENLTSFVSNRTMLRRAAHYFLETGQFEKAMLLFASIGDFHPVIAIAASKQLYFFAHLLLTLFEDSRILIPYDASKINGQQLFDTQFESLQFLEKQIGNKYMRMLQSTI